MAKLNKAQQWAHDLAQGAVTLWGPEHTRGVLMAARNTSRRHGTDDVQALLNTVFDPVRVNKHLEDKATEFWRANCKNKRNAWRNNAFTGLLGKRERELIDFYLATPRGSQAFHEFVGLRDVTIPSLYAYFQGQQREVVPVYRLKVITVSGEHHFDYAYGSWQSGVDLQIVG